MPSVRSAVQIFARVRPYLGFGCKRTGLRPGYLERRRITDIACGLCVRRNLSNATDKEVLVKSTDRFHKGVHGKKHYS